MDFLMFKKKKRKDVEQPVLEELQRTLHLSNERVLYSNNGPISKSNQTASTVAALKKKEREKWKIRSVKWSDEEVEWKTGSLGIQIFLMDSYRAFQSWQSMAP